MQHQATKTIASPTLPSAQPTYILRGHAAPIHRLLFLNNNLWLISGDADGWVVLWTLTTKRPLAVWHAHEGSILGLGLWDNDKLITHGRDSRLRIWSLTGIDDPSASFSTTLPVEKTTEERKQPWLLHALRVSTVNFCGFAALSNPREAGIPSEDGSSTSSSLIVAVPAKKDSEIALHALPSEDQVGLIPAPVQSEGRAGMVMALALFRRPGSDAGPGPSAVHVAAGYENGRAVLYRQNREAGRWETIYSAQVHTQPILSLDVTLGLDAFFTSGADAAVVKHPLCEGIGALKEAKTGHSGQQGLRVRSDGRVLATAGWDGRVRVYSAKTLKEVAVLKWHGVGVHAVDFAGVGNSERTALAGGREEVATTARNQTVAQARETRVRETHWLAAGSKDGKVSLWDIY